MTKLDAHPWNELPFRILACVFAVANGSSAIAQQQSTIVDRRDAAALMLFNGEPGARAFDTTGPIANDDTMWARQAPGAYSFSSSQGGVTVKGIKSVTVEGACKVRVATRFEWLFPYKPAENLDRTEEFDFRTPVVADVVLALRNDQPYVTILDLKGNAEFYCKSTTINGRMVESRQCSSGVRVAAGPGREDSPVLQRFASFSKACRGAT